MAEPEGRFIDEINNVKNDHGSCVSSNSSNSWSSSTLSIPEAIRVSIGSTHREERSKIFIYKTNIRNDGNGNTSDDRDGGILERFSGRLLQVMAMLALVGIFSFIMMYNDAESAEKPLLLVENTREKSHVAHPIRKDNSNNSIDMEYIAKWGHWDFVDPKANQVIRPEWNEYERVFNADGIEYRDAPNHTFPKGSWQADPEYVSSFLSEALALVQRTKEAIYHAYGATDPTDVEGRKRMFTVPIYNTTSEVKDKNQPFTTTKSFNGLIRRLLHAMMTHDNFEVVMGGHSSAAGHGNTFNQSYMMQFQTTLEPVFTRLGMNLISRNMAQGGLGTLQQSMTGMDIRGRDADIVMWDSGMTEKPAGYKDFFHRQALLGGRKAPMLWDGPVELFYNSIGADIARTINVPVGLPETKDEVQVQSLPFAAQYLICEQGVNICSNKYNTGCWVDRPDVQPPVKQDVQLGGQASWHPGFRHHMWRGRALAFFILDALESAIMLWSDVTPTAGHPLPDKYWHVTDHYRSIQEKVRTMEGPCEDDLFIPRMCKVQMHGVSEFTPRADPDNTSIRSIVRQPEGSMYKVDLDDRPVYTGYDLPSPWERIPEGAVDVNKVAGLRRLQDESKDSHSVLLSQQRISKGNDIKRRISSERLPEGDTNIDSSIFPGSGWHVQEGKVGLCDGTISSQCGRGTRQTCLLGGHNDGRGAVVGDEKSGWIVMDLKGVKNGLIVMRIETWHGGSNSRTTSWTKYNNGIGADDHNDTTTTSSAYKKSEATANDDYCEVMENRRRRKLRQKQKQEERRQERQRILKGPPPALPDDFMIDIAINGEITTQDKCTFLSNMKRIAYNFDVFTVLDDPAKGSSSKEDDNNIEVAIRMRGGDRQSSLWISHVYWG